MQVLAASRKPVFAMTGKEPLESIEEPLAKKASKTAESCVEMNNEEDNYDNSLNNEEDNYDNSLSSRLIGHF